MPVPRVSFEFFPPQSLEASFRLWEAVRALAPLNPSFVSVTYGAGGTTRQLTHEAVTTIGSAFGLRVAAHLTCVEATRAETLAIARQYAAAGVTDLVALRGDPPRGAGRFIPHPEGFADSVELVAALKAEGRFTLRVGAYPEPHPEAADAGADVRWLARKFAAGADGAITQFFFEAETFLRFRDACARAGIDGARIIPGILPIQSWAGARRFAERCGARVPGWLAEAFEKAERDGREALLATALCTELCDELIREGVEDLHFYTLNRPQLTREVCHALGVTASVALARVA
jgi:methylenetetrahydrofolate reductase (NADPH)